MGESAMYAVAYEEEIPVYLSRKERNRYLGNIIHANIHKMQDLWMDLINL